MNIDRQVITSGEFPYASAQAFGAAITERLKALGATSGRPVTQLRRQFAYDRLLARLFHTGRNEWILKGGVSMIARLGSARHTADVDLVADADSPEAGLRALHSAAAQDLGDGSASGSSSGSVSTWSPALRSLGSSSGPIHCCRCASQDWFGRHICCIRSLTRLPTR